MSWVKNHNSMLHALGSDAMPGNRKIVTAQESRAIAWKKRNCTSSLLEYFANKSF